MNTFADWFQWPMRVDGKYYSTDLALRSLLAEMWLFSDSNQKFYRAWNEGIRCGRIYEVETVKEKVSESVQA
jgi:hypothetical protein